MRFTEVGKSNQTPFPVPGQSYSRPEFFFFPVAEYLTYPGSRPSLVWGVILEKPPSRPGPAQRLEGFTGSIALIFHVWRFGGRILLVLVWER